MVPSARSSMIWPSPPAERVTDSQRPRSGLASSATPSRGAKATEPARTTAATRTARRMSPVRYASCSARTSPLLSGPMRHVQLGRTGLPVSRLCLGTMTFGLQCDEPTSFAILDRAAAGGITFLDTADVYPLGGSPETVGRTEEIVGRWLRGRRHDVVIATKCSGATSARPWDRGASRKHVLDAIDDSLRRLGSDYVDLYQIHHPDAATPMDETLRALDDVVGAGHRPQRDLGPRALRFRAAALQPALSPDRARAAAPVPGGGRGSDSLQPAGGRPALGQAPAGGGADGGHALHPRLRGSPLSGALLARARVRHR